MGFFSKDPMKELAKKVESQPKVVVNYGILARNVLVKKESQLKGVEKEVIKEMITDWEKRLRDKIDAMCIDEIKRIGKLDEFNKVLETEIDLDKYYYYAISNYKKFIDECSKKAVESL